MGSKYKPDERSKGVRLAAKRTKYDTELVHSIINQTPILHVSFNAPMQDGPPFPTILPMLGALTTYKDDEEPSLYLHGSSVARLFRLTNGNEIPLCVAGTILDGYVLALTPFHNSCNYRSAVVFGYGYMVEDPEEINFALHTITNNAIPDRWENSRGEPVKTELDSTGVLKVRIETASAKVRVGGPGDDKHDLDNQDLVGKTWTGVVPAYTALGDPLPSDYNKVKVVPEYLADWVADVNSLNEQQAVNAADTTDEAH